MYKIILSILAIAAITPSYAINIASDKIVQSCRRIDHVAVKFIFTPDIKIKNNAYATNAEGDPADLLLNGAASGVDRFGPVIYVDSDMYVKMQGITQSFILAHECGHQMLGHTVDETHFATEAENNAYSVEREKDADCIATNMLMNMGYLRSLSQIDIMKADFVATFGYTPASKRGDHPATDERFQFIKECFIRHNPYSARF